MCKYDLVCNVINRIIQSSVGFSVFSQSIYTSLFLQGSLVAREASDKERVKDTSCIHILNYEVTSCLRLKACVWIYILFLKGKELPTFKDMDFRNNMQKVYVTEEQKEKFMEKVNRDVEVRDASLL